ncbi:EcsC family protein [Tolumonas lignilytica]|uniref:EcsC family protein n=1 Tax=Tolumonas lignilytica TaxID=1283284 RepID=UPI00046330A4|nr:EcsC family protein [Tolumonas lignilytica]
MTEKVTQNKIMAALDWTYEKAVEGGIPGLDSAIELADDYINSDGTITDKVNSLIRWQNTKAGTSGFINGLGGFALMPVTIPANITSVMYVQVRMIAAIAHMGGHNLKDDRIKTLVYTCLCGNAAKDIIKDIGITVGTKLTQQAIKNISQEVIVKINQAVGFRLITKFGQTGAINLGKAVPIIGGLIGATFDSVATNTIGNIARDTFVAKV